MHSRLGLLLLALTFSCGPVFAGGTFTWPEVIPPGANPTAMPLPRMDWFERFQKNLEASAKQPKIDLIFDGDSITDFWMTTGRAVWDQHYAGLNAFDFGVSGDRTENVLWRLQQGQLGANAQPKLIFLMIGTNNLSRNPVEQIIGGVKAVVEEYRKERPDATVVLQAIFPRSANPTDPYRQKIKDINKAISGLAGDKVIYLDFADKFLQPDGTLSREIMPDFLHPSAAGYRIWADAIQPTIDKFYPQATKG
jgi:lysophospholipase L1-like esterase